MSRSRNPLTLPALTNYDGIFCLENFDDIERSLLDKIGLQIFDTRSALKHDSNNLVEHEAIENPNKKTALELLILKESGLKPKLTEMIDEEWPISYPYYIRQISTYIVRTSANLE